MTGPALAKHEKDLKLLETMLEDVRKIAAQNEGEYRSQIAALAHQMTEMGFQVNNLTNELKADRQGIASQIKELVDTMKIQKSGNHSNPGSTSHSAVSSTNLNTTTPSKPIPVTMPISGHNSQKFPHVGNPPVFMHASPNFVNPNPTTVPINSQSMTSIPPHTFSATAPPFHLPNPDHHQQLPLLYTHVNPPPTFQHTTYMPNPIIHPPSYNTSINHMGDSHFTRSIFNTPYKIPNVEFPKFDGQNPRGWVLKASKFFSINPIWIATQKSCLPLSISKVKPIFGSKQSSMSILHSPGTPLCNSSFSIFPQAIKKICWDDLTS